MALPLFQMLWKLGAPQRRRNTIFSRRVGSKKSRVAIWRRRFPVAVNFVANKDAADRVVHDITSIGGRAVAIHVDVAREEEILRPFRGGRASTRANRRACQQRSDHWWYHAGRGAA